MVYNKADFKKHIETIQIDGFKLKSAVQAYLFVRKHKDRTETITISYRNYAPHGFYIDGVSADIYFNEIEEAINPLLDKYNISNRYGDTTIQKSLIDIDSIDYSKLQIEINDELSSDIVIQEVKKIITLGAFPFFTKYETLNNVALSMKNMNEDDLSNFVSGIVGVKIPLIKKMVSSSDYSLELKNRNEFYKNDVFKYPQYFKDHEKVFKELFSSDLEISL